jgi:hypothetical protein
MGKEGGRLFPLDASEDGVVLDVGFVTEDDVDQLR